MTDDKANTLDDLLARMPEIAKAVSAFPEGVQQSAFDALMSAASGAVAPEHAPAAGEEPNEASRRRSRTRRKRDPAIDAKGAKPRRKGSRQTKVIKDLDLRPKGKKSLADFVKEKSPDSNHDKHAVALYYLSNIAGISPVTIDHVFTVWREVGWKLPPEFATSMRLSATKKRFFDTGDSDNLRLLNPGVNRVEQDLPLQKKS